jgi:hypothetical protein
MPVGTGEFWVRHLPDHQDAARPQTVPLALTGTDSLRRTKEQNESAPPPPQALGHMLLTRPHPQHLAAQRVQQ